MALAPYVGFCKPQKGVTDVAKNQQQTGGLGFDHLNPADHAAMISHAKCESNEVVAPESGGSAGLGQISAIIVQQE
jgi:hypothetical protein